MSSIYELTGEYLELMDMLEDEEVDEQTIIDTLEALVLCNRIMNIKQHIQKIHIMKLLEA